MFTKNNRFDLDLASENTFYSEIADELAETINGGGDPDGGDDGGDDGSDDGSDDDWDPDSPYPFPTLTKKTVFSFRGGSYSALRSV